MRLHGDLTTTAIFVPYVLTSAGSAQAYVPSMQARTRIARSAKLRAKSVQRNARSTAKSVTFEHEHIIQDYFHRLVWTKSYINDALTKVSILKKANETKNENHGLNLSLLRWSCCLCL